MRHMVKDQNSADSLRARGDAVNHGVMDAELDVREQQLTAYERGQLAQLRSWQRETPGWGTRLLAKPSSSAAQMVQAVVPVQALRSTLKGLEKAAHKFGGPAPILRRAKVQSLAELREVTLQNCDRLAKFEERSSVGVAGVAGAVLGVAGAAGMVIDVPALITQAMRVIYRTALCYGEDLAQDAQQGLSIGIFALVSANSMHEKQAALQALMAQQDLLDAAWRDGVERVAERELAKEAAVFSLQTLASRIGLHLGQRKVAGTVPVLGAAVGGAVNAWYIHEVAQTARYVFQERWLRARYAKTSLSPDPS